MVLTVFTTLFSLITNLDIQSDFINFNLCKFLVVDTMDYFQLCLITNLDIQSDFINFNLCKFLVVDTMDYFRLCFL
jgi:hypothetical protein